MSENFFRLWEKLSTDKKVKVQKNLGLHIVLASNSLTKEGYKKSL